MVQSFGRVGGDPQCFADRWNATSEQIGNGLPLHELDRDIELAQALSDVEERCDARVLERGRGTSFVHESAPRLIGVDEIAREELERDLAVEGRVLGLQTEPIPPSPSFPTMW